MSLFFLNHNRINSPKGFYSNVISFGSERKDYQSKLPKPINKLAPEQKPVNIEVSFDLGTKLIEYANKLDLTVNDYILQYMKHLAPRPGVIAEKSTTANIGRTKVTTLIDAEQIFDKTIEFIKSAEKSIQVEMFEFQNLKIDGDV